MLMMKDGKVEPVEAPDCGLTWHGVEGFHDNLDSVIRRSRYLTRCYREMAYLFRPDDRLSPVNGQVVELGEVILDRIADDLTRLEKQSNEHRRLTAGAVRLAEFRAAHEEVAAAGFVAEADAAEFVRIPVTKAAEIIRRMHWRPSQDDAADREVDRVAAE